MYVIYALARSLHTKPSRNATTADIVTYNNKLRCASLDNHRARVIIVRVFMENGREPSIQIDTFTREERESRIIVSQVH